MFEWFESTYNCRVIQWAEWTGDGVQYTVVTDRGCVIVADSLELLVLELLPLAPPYRLAA